MKVVYEITNLGRGKWCGAVTAQTGAVEHVEGALMKVARKHLMSQDIDFDGDTESGKFIVGGFREVGTYRRREVICG